MPARNALLADVVPAGVAAFEIGNCASTLLILRATGLFAAGHGRTAAAQLAVLLYVEYNVAAALVSVPAGRHGDRHDPGRVLVGGAVLFAAGYAWFAAGPAQPMLLLPAFVLARWISAAARPRRARPPRRWHQGSCAGRRSGCWPRSRPAGT